MVTYKNYNVNLASLSDKKLMYDFAKEMNSDLKATGNKSTRDRTLIKLLKLAGLLVSASGISKTTVLSCDPDELCHRINYYYKKNTLEILLKNLTRKLLL